MVFRKSKSDEKEEAIEQIICKRYDNFYRMAYSYVHDEADAFDIVQEGACRAIQRSDSLKDVSYAATWVYRIMLNETFRFLEKKKKETYDELESIEYGRVDEYENIDLKRALDEMEPKDKAVIQLKYFEEYTLSEIAQILEENTSTVKSRLYRGLKKLRIKLEDEE